MRHQRTLKVTIRTPGDTVFESEVLSMRVPTHTGQVGFRPAAEPAALAIEAGLVVLKTKSGTKYAGTAGGLLHNNGQAASLLTPLAVVGNDVDSVSQKLDSLLAAPSEEMEVRRTLSGLEKRILQELQQENPGETAGQ